jgi:flagellar protein FliO/FliZ
MMKWLWMAFFNLSLVQSAVAAPGTSTLAQSQIKLVFVLLVVIVLAIIAAFVLKRFQRFTFQKDGIFKILASMPLGTREKIVLLKVGDEQVVVGVTSHSINPIHILDKSNQVHLGNAADVSSGFAEKLRQAIAGSTKS